jgi:hypothetical protein
MVIHLPIGLLDVILSRHGNMYPDHVIYQNYGSFYFDISTG